MNLLKEYNQNCSEADIEVINKIIYNDSSHIVSLFKEFLIYEDLKELFQFYNKKHEIKHLLDKLTENEPKNLIRSTYLINQTNEIKRAVRKKKKIERIKAEENVNRWEESTLLRTTFMNKIAKEDLSNSISILPSNSLECSRGENPRLISELLYELENSPCEEINLNQTKECDKIIPGDFEDVYEYVCTWAL